MNGIETDIHIWTKPETERMVTLYTISCGRRSICVDAPMGLAMRSLQNFLEEQAEEAEREAGKK
jgi:hypothetical protein